MRLIVALEGNYTAGRNSSFPRLGSPGHVGRVRWEAPELVLLGLPLLSLRGE